MYAYIWMTYFQRVTSKTRKKPDYNLLSECSASYQLVARRKQRPCTFFHLLSSSSPDDYPTFPNTEICLLFIYTTAHIRTPYVYSSKVTIHLIVIALLQWFYCFIRSMSECSSVSDYSWRHFRRNCCDIVSITQISRIFSCRYFPRCEIKKMVSSTLSLYNFRKASHKNYHFIWLNKMNKRSRTKWMWH